MWKYWIGVEYSRMLLKTMSDLRDGFREKDVYQTKVILFKW